MRARRQEGQIERAFGAYLLFEPPLPVRHHLPAQDVRMDLLRASDTRTFCAYKGQASYLSYGDEADLAWTYRPRSARPRR